MDKDKLIEIVKDVENKSNNDLFIVEKELYEEFEKTKTLILDLTKHLDVVENLYSAVNGEIEKRIRK